MKLDRKLLAPVLIAALAALAALAGAQEGTPPADSQTRPPATPPASPPGDSQPAPRPGEDDVFIPTEEVEAAEELAFPVDI